MPTPEESAPEDRPELTDDEFGRRPGAEKSDRELARELLHRMKISPELRARFDHFDRGLSAIAFRDPRNGELVLAKSGIRSMLMPLTTPQQAASIIAAMESALGDRLREDRQEAAWVSWDTFLQESGMARRESDLFRSHLAQAQTSDDLKRALKLAVPASGTTADAEGKIRRWIDGVSGRARLADDGQTVLDDISEAINPSAVNACIQQRVAAWWWGIALFAAACMIITFPNWQLGLIFAGLALAGWLLVIILSCIFSQI